MSNTENTFQSIEEVRFLNGNLISTITNGHDLRARLDRAHEAISYLLGQLDKRRNPPPLLDINSQSFPNVPMKDSDRRIAQQLNYIGAEIDGLLQEVGGEQFGFVTVTIPINRPGPSWTIQNVKPLSAVKALKRQVENLNKYLRGQSHQISG